MHLAHTLERPPVLSKSEYEFTSCEPCLENRSPAGSLRCVRAHVPGTAPGYNPAKKLGRAALFTCTCFGRFRQFSRPDLYYRAARHLSEQGLTSTLEAIYSGMRN